MDANEARWRGQRGARGLLAARRNLGFRQRGRGHYEVYYVKLVEPRSRRGFWFRYTLLSPLAETALEPRAEVWAASFVSGAEPRAAKESFPVARWASTARPFALRVGDAELRADGARGAAGDISWDLQWEPTASPHRPYPFAWMYRAAWPRTKMLVPNLDLRVRGSVQVGREFVKLDDAPGEQAHLWGSRHAHEWAWSHCNAFEEEPGAVFEGLTAFPEPGRGPLTLLHVRQTGGRAWSFNGPFVMRRTRSNFATDRWAFSAQSGRERMKGVVSAPLERLGAVEYTDPDGSPRFCHHTELADLELTLSERKGGAWRDVQRLTCRGLAAFESAAHAHDSRVRRLL